ncbi:hypothetical protein MJO28_014114 [Puccinia striiformis f. sp. tritici]|uniref:Uncharacterized protein n=4 Tax=Puccinia striiformis TaxID=27350 RepID=A0A0L0W1Q8_9BASI|nr:hypothetical protein Pst134EA_025404 [Puccinia striiformis f. sp. tritici]KAI9622816.1 hypothetical protein KEM48_009749 [Puccinia striiformis f. sp. tritici PST-130]KNF05205.1 hypothetical protein PSTG_01830 [Puccinia striiformis f. sp. tritici PST-78]POW00292.1 hypothetical protein PSHT_13114 [Puccinia striiformis]KAH9443639.1 hypothetical protein Pst134EB_026040 [Puccinia striiformis f. sp. tritici]KAH9451450.1 hypothetical protein Pst134EA_025404 [Puccinia striiformis f. sp. tritici]
MIPPRLASHLQNLITRKLLESSAFNEFVARTDGVFHSIRLGLKEGWEEENQESSKQGTSSSHDDHYQQKNSQPKTTTSSESNSNFTDHRKTFYSSQDSPQASKSTTEQDQSRHDTEQKLKELLEKLRRQ